MGDSEVDIENVALVKKNINDKQIAIDTETDSDYTDDPNHKLIDKCATKKHSEDNEDKQRAEYENILQQTKNKVYIILFLTMAEPLLTSSRYPFLVLYIQSFASNITTSTISLIVFIAMLYYAISTLIYTSLGDKYGHDRMFILSFIFLATGLLCESIATSFPVFILGYFITKVPNIPVAFAYIPRILPHQLSVRYCALLWTICAVIYLLGPIVGAVIAQYFGYRSIWIINTIIHMIFFMISFFCLRGSVSKLEKLQTPLGIINFLDDDEQFPVCIKNQRLRIEAEEGDPARGHNISTDGPETVQTLTLTQNPVINYFKFWYNLPSYDLWMLLNAIIMNNAAWAIEAIVIFYYVLFMVNRYDTDIVYSTFMLVELTVIYGVTNLLVPRMINRILPKYVWIITITSGLLLLVCILCVMERNLLVYYWVYDIFIAVLFGVISISSEMCILELQPKQHTGKVTGLKGCIKYIFRGSSTGLVGLFWLQETNYSSLWYGVGILCCIVFILSVHMLVMNCIFKK